jgi:hypothetical protein
MIYTLDNTLKQTAEQHNLVHLIKALLALLSIIGAVIINVLSYTNFKELVYRLYIPIINSIAIGLFLFVLIFRVVKGNSLFVYGLVMMYNNVIGYYQRYPTTVLSSTNFSSFQMFFFILSFLGILLPGSNKLRTKKSSLNEIFALNTSK